MNEADEPTREAPGHREPGHGEPYPSDGGAPRPGAAWDGEATTFSVLSRHVRAVEVCLFEHPESASSVRREPLRRVSGDRWSVRLEGVGPGALYGYRADGPFSPQEGHVFNASKLLIDPWARAVSGEPRPDEALWACPNPKSVRIAESRANQMEHYECLLLTTLRAASSMALQPKNNQRGQD